MKTVHLISDAKKMKKVTFDKTGIKVANFFGKKWADFFPPFDVDKGIDPLRNLKGTESF